MVSVAFSGTVSGYHLFFAFDSDLKKCSKDINTKESSHDMTDFMINVSNITLQLVTYRDQT